MPTIIEIARAYILRGEAYSAVQEHFTEGGFKDYDDGQKCMDRIKAIPAADVVELRHGKWIDKNNEGSWNYCSVCGQQAIDLYDFCPSCGAVMDGGQDE